MLDALQHVTEWFVKALCQVALFAAFGPACGLAVSVHIWCMRYFSDSVLALNFSCSRANEALQSQNT